MASRHEQACFYLYNCVSLGFTLYAIYFLLIESHLIGSLFFVLALNYKQMSLYHAFPFFFYLLGICLKQSTWSRKIIKLISIGVVVIVSFIVCMLGGEIKLQYSQYISYVELSCHFAFWIPFLSSLEDTLHVVERLFPFNRGLYEDKVANVWCSLSIIFKLKSIFSQTQIVKLCLVSTVLACIPSCLNLLVYPTKKKFLFSLASCSMAFFLFSYQVHEKSILIVSLPVLLLIFHAPSICSWFLLISTFSMYPLLVRDGQTIAYFASIAIFIVFSSWLSQTINRNTSQLIHVLSYISLTICLVIHISFATIKPPDRFPDIFPLFFAIYSCGHFVLFFIYLNYEQWKCDKNDVDIEDIFDEVKKLKSS